MAMLCYVSTYSTEHGQYCQAFLAWVCAHIGSMFSLCKLNSSLHPLLLGIAPLHSRCLPEETVSWSEMKCAEAERIKPREAKPNVLG